MTCRPGTALGSRSEEEIRKTSVLDVEKTSACHMVGHEAFTILELVTVLLIVAILITMLIPAFKGFQDRAEKAKCINNLKTVSVAVNLYIQDKSQWPQIDPGLIASDHQEYSKEWIDALHPYGLTHTNWVCPTVQRLMGGPDLEKSENTRVDYLAMPFDSKRITPFRWSTHPWFVERGNVHGNGNLIIFSNGTIRESNDFFPK